MGAIRRCIVGALMVITSATLVACTNAPAGPEPEPTSVADSPSAAPEPEPDPELVAGGTAEDNLPYFDFMNAKFLADGNPGGRPVIDNLVAAGFDKAAMEVTGDRTPLGNDVDSVQFSVLIGEDCLLGQAGGGGYTGIVAPALETGTCLIGNTRAIDW